MDSSSEHQQDEEKSEEEENYSQQSYEQDQHESSNNQTENQNNQSSVFTTRQKQFFYNQCQNIINQLMKLENAFFLRPVDPEKDVAPGYYEFIAHPMSIYDVQQKIDNDRYQSTEEFINDMRLIWSNAKLYNAPSHLVYKAADALSSKFEMMASTLPHIVEENSLSGGFQREIELRFARYRLMKKTHL